MQNHINFEFANEEQKTSRIESPKKFIRNRKNSENLGKFLKYKLINAKILFEKIQKYFEQKQEIKNQELVENLYIIINSLFIEDNSQQFVEFTLLKINDICVIKGKLKKVIGKYTVINEEQQSQMMDYIGQQIWKCSQSIVELIKMIVQKKTNSQFNDNENEVIKCLSKQQYFLEDKQKEILGYLLMKSLTGQNCLNIKV
ncbi:unnamed protein product [Paramecium sonneborni]|uniref:Uncharacterized protein n=1 Tax=Paramecium sonneborni TaxID=65129 RepID=A0A8S1NXW1_9CILI|nr:unnamed protein product [Paramecium sonneborni]